MIEPYYGKIRFSIYEGYVYVKITDYKELSKGKEQIWLNGTYHILENSSNIWIDSTDRNDFWVSPMNAIDIARLKLKGLV